MAKQRFIATSRKDCKTIIGVWENVCDLDKRNWNVQPYNPKDREGIKPLCYIEVIPTYKSGDDIVDSVLRPINSHHDLVGIYV